MRDETAAEKFSRGRFVVMGVLLLKERLGVFHRVRTASVSAL
jgi:hypothetical protein